jgi:uncharacterized Zn-binding protein involved in type VI secretion
MAGAARLGDKAQVQQDSHGCPGCPHPGVGPAISGSSNVNINGRPAVRVDDVGIHAVCCGPNMWSAAVGSATVFVNGKPLVRQNDQTRHCGGQGKMIEGSDDVIVGGSPSSSGSAAGGSGGDGGAADSSSGGGSSAASGGSAAAGNAGQGSAAAGASSSAASGAGAASTTAASSSATTAGQQDKPADTADGDEEVTFKVSEHAVDGSAVGGVSVVVEFSDGHRETLESDSSGNVKARRKKGQTFQVISIDEKEGGET